MNNKKGPCRKTIRRRARRKLQKQEEIDQLRGILLAARTPNNESDDSQESDIGESDSDWSSDGNSSSASENASVPDDVHMQEDVINPENDANFDSDGENEGELDDFDSNSENQEERDENFDRDEGNHEEQNEVRRQLTEDEKEEYVIQAIREWAVSGGVLSMTKLDELLNCLSPVFKKMPKSYKTLLKTDLQVEIRDMVDHLFWYKGIAKNFDEMNLDAYLARHGGISIDIGMDGLALFSSARKKKFWPILGRLRKTWDDPFIIAVYYGYKDPADMDLFLGDFIAEVEHLQQQGYTNNERSYPFLIDDFILDAPARSKVKCCIGHMGYGACEKCTVAGEYESGRVNFAVIGANVEPRTDESYVNQNDHLHHTGHSPLELVGIGMVSQFRLDTMHLVYEGVFARFLEAQMKWEGEWKLSAAKVREISALLIPLNETRPSDLNRPVRELEEYDKYKATEYRRMLLYDGMLVFKDKLHETIYPQFLLLHCAMFILTSPHFLPLFIDEAEQFIEEFIDHCRQVYGNHFVSYNVHSLKHLPDECRDHGSADDFSAFTYENYLKTIKQTLKSGYKPLHQLARRDSEKKQKRNVKMHSEENTVELFHRHAADLHGAHFKKIHVNNIVLKIRAGSQRECYFMTDAGDVVVLTDIIRTNENSVNLVGKKFHQKDNFYTYPMSSSRLGILKVWELSDVSESFPLTDVFAKCWLMKSDDTYLSVPLLHSTSVFH